MANVMTCPVHRTNLVDYNGQQWCHFCAAEKHDYFEQFRRWFVFLQWGMVAAVPLCIVGLAALAPVSKVAASDTPPQAFWWWLLLPTVFMTAYASVMLGHMTLRGLFSVIRQTSRLLPWFNPAYMLRDAWAIAIISSPVYTLLLYYGQSIPHLIGAAESVNSWLAHRAWIILLINFLAILFLDRVRWINSDAILPHGSDRHRYILWYALISVASYLYIQHWLAALAMSQPGPGLFLVALGLLLLCVTVYLVISVMLRLSARRVGGGQQGPIPATIALVGPSNAGKTVFLARAYSLLNTVRAGMLNLEPTAQSKQAIDPILKELEDARQWPPGTVKAADIPFGLFYGLDEIVRFHWLDLPGAVFTNIEDPRYQAEITRFSQQLENADAVAMVVDAEDLAAALGKSSIRYEHIYYHVTKTLYTRLRNIGKAARPVPLAVIVTKSCLVEPSKRLRLPAALRNLCDFWRNLAHQGGLSSPPVKIFLTSAVVTGRQGGNSLPPQPEPLVSDHCVEAVLWLAAQTMRANLNVLDLASGFHGRSDLQSSILRLEATASR